jgi:glycolate oxidase iron-sulfur subunit
VASNSRWPDPSQAPALADLAKCVHCGLCVNACPTYVVTGLEAESPRGRIYLARAIEEDRIDLSATVRQHWDLCLQCRACEEVCPSGVPFGRIMEHARAEARLAAPAGSRFRRLVLRNFIARPRVLATVLAPVRAFASSPLRKVARATRALRLLGPLGRAEAQLPATVGLPFRAGDLLAQPANPEREAELFTGCVMGELFGEVHRATGRVLARSGVALTARPDQGCCGALHAHDGDLDFARHLARKNIDAFEGGNTPIVVNSAGCGAAMKEYGDLLSDDPAYADRARTFAARVFDFSEYLASLGPAPAGLFEGRVVYQDACHLAHVQRIREQPRSLLHAIAGCEVSETEESDLCCGAAGIYSLVQPEMSAQLRSRKAAQFAKHKPDVVITTNPGCQMQFEAAVREAGIKARVMHLAEFLDRAYRALTP